MSEKKEKARIPRQQRSIQTKQQIIDAAMKLFSQKGFHGTNSKEIAMEAGVATGCFYSYFTDKRAVFLEVLTIYYDQFNKILREHISLYTKEQCDPKALLQGLIKSILDAHNIFTEFHNELVVMYYSDQDIYKVIQAQHEAGMQFTLSCLDAWKDKIILSDLDSAAAIVYWSVHNVVDNVILSENADSRQKLINELVDMIARYLFG